MLRRPRPEINDVADHNAALWVEPMEDTDLVRAQHDALAEVYRAHGVAVHYVENGWPDKPNGHFVRDLMLMTPEGAIVTRPASQQRAGEERYFSAAAVREMDRLMQAPESQVRLAPVPVIAFTPVG